MLYNLGQLVTPPPPKGSLSVLWNWRTLTMLYNLVQLITLPPPRGSLSSAPCLEILQSSEAWAPRHCSIVAARLQRTLPRSPKQGWGL